MSSATAVVSAKSSPSRKRPIPSSIRSSPPPPSAKRHGLSSTSNSRRSTNKHGREIHLQTSADHHERTSRSKQPYRQLENKSSSSESSRSSSCSNHSVNHEYSARSFDQSKVASRHASEAAVAKRPYFNNNKSESEMQADLICTKKPTSLAVIVKPSAKLDESRICNRDDDHEQTKQLPNKVLAKSTSALVPSSVMTIVKPTAVLSKKSLRTDNVIIQKMDGTINASSSTKVVKLVVPHTKSSASSIKMLSSGDGLASALRIPTKIQLTKTLFVPPVTPEKAPCSLISTTASHEDQSILSPSLAAQLLDTPTDATESQPSTGDYSASATLPLTPPPPVIDSTTPTVRNILSHTAVASQEEHRDDLNEMAMTNTKAIEETHSASPDEHSNRPNTPKRHPSTLPDWSVPPTSELSPTSLTSSSPDLTQTHGPSDDSLVEHDSSTHVTDSTNRHRRRSWSTSCSALPSFTTSYLQSADKTSLKPIQSKSVTQTSSRSHDKLTGVDNARSITMSPVLQLSSSQRTKRRRKNENLVGNQYSEKIYKSKMKQLKVESDEPMVVKDLLAEIVERVADDNALTTLPNKPSSQAKQIALVNRFLNRQNSLLRTPTTKKKGKSLLQSTESAAMVMTSKELDELACLLHANVHRANYERMADPAKADERMRESWSQMSEQKKSTYYKRVLQVYKRPRPDVITPPYPSTIEKHSFSSNDVTDNTNSPLLSADVLSVELKRQPSTPLSFQSIPSSATDDQSIISPPESTFRTTISAHIVNELIKGANGLDKLSCSPAAFTSFIEAFARSTMSQQTEKVNDLEQRLEKKCSSQLNRATLFWKQRIQYFAAKHQIHSSHESMNELTLIVKYFYLLVLSLNYQKREMAFRQAISNLLHGNLTFIDPSFCSSVLTSIIEDLILCSSLANEYLASQPLIIDDVEHSLPFIRNCELENELLHANETSFPSNPFANSQDLQEYLNRCENPTMNIPCYPFQQPHHPSMYYPAYHSSSQYYYPPSQQTEVKNYYYNAPSTYPHSPQGFPYAQPPPYYHPPPVYANNNPPNTSDQLQYYYHSQQHPSYSYPPQSNSTNDIPLPTNSSHHRSYRPTSANTKRTHSNSQQSAISSATPRASVVASSQSNSINTTNHNYPP